MFTCGRDDITESVNVKTAPAKMEIMMSPKASISDITSVKLMVSGPGMENITADLIINKELGKASGSINVPIGNDRLFRVEVYSGGFLRYIGEQKTNVQSAISVNIPVGIKSAEGVGAIGISEQIKGKGLALAIGDVNIFLSKSPGNVKLIQNLVKNFGTTAKLKFDLSLGSTLTQEHKQALEQALRDGGFQVKQDESSSYDRNSYDTIFLCLPTNNPSSSQINSLVDFVRNGGMLILVGDADENLDPLNLIGNAFGLSFDYSLINVPGGNPASLMLSNFATLPIFDGVGTIEASNARSLKVKSGSLSDMNTYNAATPGASAITILDEPKLFVNPSQLDLGTILDSGQTDIENNGTGILSWNVSTETPLPSWLKISPDNGKNSSGQKRNISVNVERTGLNPGEYRQIVLIKSNAGDGNLLVIMSVPEPSPSLSFSPSSIDFGLTDAQLTITNKGGRSLDWKASKQQSWLSLSSSSGSLSSGNSVNITLTVNRSGLKSGTYRDVVSLTSNGGNGDVAITMLVPEPLPSLSFSPSIIDFGVTDTQKTFNVSNIGGGTINLVINKQQSWLGVSPSNLSLLGSEVKTVTLTVNRAGMKQGTYKDVVSLTSNGGNGNVTISMTVPEPLPSLLFSPSSYDFGITDTQNTLKISNNGGGILNWQASKALAWLSLSSSSGSIPSGNSEDITLKVNRGDLKPGSYRDVISITSNDGKGDVPVVMTVPEPAPSLSYSPQSIGFGAVDTNIVLTILNLGGGTLNWQASKQQDWLSLSLTSGSLSSGKQDSITLTVNRASLKSGSYQDVISLISNAGNGEVPVNMTVPEPASLMVFEPLSFDFGIADIQNKLTLSNAGGGNLEWQLSNQQPWLSLSSTSGSIPAISNEPITVKVDRANLKPGSYNDVIKITSSFGNGEIPVTMTVPEPAPVLSFDPKSVDFGTTETQKSLIISNTGGGTLAWQASKQQTWLSLSSVSGSLASGKSEIIILEANRANLNPDSYKDAISLTSDGGNGNVPVTMTVPEPAPSLSFDPKSVDFGTIDIQKSLTISNVGGEALTWQASKQQSWLSLSSVSGSLTFGKSETITLNVNKADLKPGSYRDVISITSNGGRGDVIVTMTVPEPPPSLSFSPSSLDFGNADTERTMTINNVGGETLSWQASKQQPWLSLSQTSGSLTLGKSSAITIKVSRADLTPDSYKDVISLTSDGGNGNVTVTMGVILTNPIMAFSPTSLDFSTTDTQNSLTITNTGGGILTWQVARQQEWLTLSPSVGSLESGISATITAKVSRNNITPGSYKDAISITTNAGNGSVPVAMTVPEPPPTLSVSPKSLDFGSDSTQLTLAITNNGSGTLNWEASSKETWFSLSTQSDSLGNSKSTNVTVTVERSAIKTGSYTGNIDLTSNGGNNSIPVTLLMPGLEFSPLSLDFGLSDAQKTLTIRNNGAGTLVWKASNKETWLSLSSTGSSLSAGSSINVTVTVTRADLKPFAYTDTIALTSNGGNGSLPVTMPIPGLSLSPTALNFGSADTQLKLTISNIGGGPLNWQASKRQAWLTLDPTSGAVPEGTSVDITATISKTGITPGSYSDVISIASDVGDNTVSVSMNVAGFFISVTSLDYGSLDTQKSVTITNNGSGALMWQASNKETWLTVNPTSGTVEANRSANVTVTVSRTDVNPGSYSDTIVMTSNAGERRVAVAMSVANLAFTPTAFNFGTTETQGRLVISNNGSGSLSWSAEKTQAWLTLSPISGFIASGASTVVTVTASGIGSPPGTQTDTISLTSNGGNGSIPVTILIPGLSFTPESLNFSAGDINKTLTISNIGAGTLTWQALKQQSWLTISPTSGSVDEGQSVSVTATVNSDIVPGIYSDIITLTSNGGNGNVPITVAIPGLSFTPKALSFGMPDTQKTFAISNSGGGTLTWQASKQQPWLTINPISGSVDAGKSADVTITVSRTELLPGNYTDTISLTSNGGNGSVSVAMSIPGLVFSPQSIDFGTSDTQKRLTISNSGSGTLKWQASKQQPWLTINPASGSLDAGNSISVLVSVLRTNLKSEGYKDTISLTSDGGVGQVNVTMTVSNPTLSVSPILLDFGTTTTDLPFNIDNLGGDVLNWQIDTAKLPAWLKVSSSSGSTLFGTPSTVTATVSRANLDPIEYTSTIPITSNGGDGNVTVFMTVLGPSLSVDPTRLNFGTATDVLSFTINNTGVDTLSLAVTSNVAWAYFGVVNETIVRQITGIIEPNGFKDFRVFVSRGAVDFVPGNYNGLVSVTSNGGNATVNLLMSVVDNQPVAVNDNYSTNENTALTVPTPGILINDTDVDGNTLIAVLVSNPAHGTLALNRNGSFRYTPNANWNGTDSFTYRANDGLVDSNDATVTITVTPFARLVTVVAVNDNYNTNEDTPLIVAASGILGNDTHAAGNTLIAVLVSNPAHGTLALSANGSFRYTPNVNWNGTDRFTYRANDGTADSNVATVTITVIPVNDPPVAVNDNYSTNENTALTVPTPGVLINDTDVEGDTLTSVLASNPAHGKLALNRNGSFTYTPNVNWNDGDSFTYKANDGAIESPPATVNITITPIVAEAPMVRIPAGNFQMGDAFKEGNADDLPVHTVSLNAFYIDRYEVTNAQYRKFMRATGYKAPAYWNDLAYNAQNQPVVGVTWYDAKAYADWAGKRLPTEAEWEKAARGGLVGKRYPWGNDISHNNANYLGTGGRDQWDITAPVGSFASNGYELYDIAGNVLEWCADWYGSNYYANSPESNPTGPSSGTYKVARGGSWNFDANLQLVAYRFNNIFPSNFGRNLGFRCVK